MTFLISLSDVQQIKRQLGLKLPNVKSSHRVEAMARGLGWKSNAALRAALICAPTECSVQDTVFDGYLAERGFDVPLGTLSSVVREVCAEAPIKAYPIEGEKPKTPSEAVPSSWTALFAGRAALLAAFTGAFLALSYLYDAAEDAQARLDLHVEQILTAAEGAATRSVLILDQALAVEVVQSFRAYPHVISAKVFDDHGTLLAQQQEAGQTHAQNTTRTLAALFVRESEKQYIRTLNLPPSLGDRPAMLELTVDREKGLSMVYGPTPFDLILFFFVGAFATFAMVAGLIALRRRLHSHLLAQYRLQIA